MSSNTFAAASTFGLLSGAALSAVLAFGLLGAAAAVIGTNPGTPRVRTERVVAASVLMLPGVVVTGRRTNPTRLVVEADSPRPVRVQ